MLMFCSATKRERKVVIGVEVMQLTSTSNAPVADTGTEQSGGGFDGAMALGHDSPQSGISRGNPIAPPARNGGGIAPPAAPAQQDAMAFGAQTPAPAGPVESANPIAPPAQSSDGVRALAAQQAAGGQSDRRFESLIVFKGEALEQVTAQLTGRQNAHAAFDDSAAAFEEKNGFGLFDPAPASQPASGDAPKPDPARAEAQAAGQDAALAAFDGEVAAFEEKNGFGLFDSPSNPVTPGSAETAQPPGPPPAREPEAPLRRAGPVTESTSEFNLNIVEGTDGDDTLVGTEGSDQIRGGAGDDTLKGGGNFDEVFGGDGDDTLHSGTGVTNLFGEAGDDTVIIDGKNTALHHEANGGEGDDLLVIEGEKSNYEESTIPYDENTDTTVYEHKDGESAILATNFERVEFRPGTPAETPGKTDVPAATPEAPVTDEKTAATPAATDETVAAPETPGKVDEPAAAPEAPVKDDASVGGDGNDTFRGGLADGGYDGGDGEDHIIGGSGNEVFSGGNGNDSLSGQDGEDTLDGGAGDDVLSGGRGSDSLRGGDGADTLYGGDGDDLLIGGDGDDTVVIDGVGRSAAVGGDGHDTLVLAGTEADWTNSVQEDGSSFYTHNGEGEESTTNVTATGFEEVTYRDASPTAAPDRG